MLWVKAFHIIAVICWFAALFYLPRLFVYHSTCDDKNGRERFNIMQRKLYRGIAIPSMIATLILGFWLISYNVDYYKSAAWLHAKLTLVIILVGYQHICGRFVKQFARGNCHKSHVFFRWFNEFPVLLLVAIIILVVVKPFS